MATVEGRRQATQLIATSFEHIPAELLAHQMSGVAGCKGTLPMIEYAIREGYRLDAEQIACPVRIVWGTGDKLLPWPAAAARYRNDWLPHADLGRARRHRALPAARRPAGDGRADRGVHGALTSWTRAPDAGGGRRGGSRVASSSPSARA